jgi:hypothetical protein
VDGLDAEIALDGVSRFVGDVPPQLFSTPAGVQPDERTHDHQQEQTEQRKRAHPEDPAGFSLSRPVVFRLGRRPPRLIARLWRVLGHRLSILVIQPPERTWNARGETSTVNTGS